MILRGREEIRNFSSWVEIYLTSEHSERVKCFSTPVEKLYFYFIGFIKDTLAHNFIFLWTNIPNVKEEDVQSSFIYPLSSFQSDDLYSHIYSYYLLIYSFVNCVKLPRLASCYFAEYFCEDFAKSLNNLWLWVLEIFHTSEKNVISWFLSLNPLPILCELFKGTVSWLCARASVICFFLQKTIELSCWLDKISFRTSLPTEIWFTFSSNILDFRRSVSSY